MVKKLSRLLRSKKGAALIVAMLLLIVLTILGLAAVKTSTTEIEISANERRAQCVLYAADAGLQAALEQLSRKNTDAIPPSGPPVSIGNNAFFRSGPICPDTDDDGECDVDDDGNIVPQPLDLVGLVTPAGSSPGSGYELYGFRITGICGPNPQDPKAREKEIEIRARRFSLGAGPPPGEEGGPTGYNVGL